MTTTATAATLAYVERVLRYLASLRYFFDSVDRLLAFVSRAEKREVRIYTADLDFGKKMMVQKQMNLCTYWKVLLLVAVLPQYLPPLSSEHPGALC